MASNLPQPSHVFVPYEKVWSKGAFANTAQVVETLLKNRAFVVKKPMGGGPGSGQLSWAKNGGVDNAWNLAKQKAGLE